MAIHSGRIRPYAPSLVEFGRVLDAGVIFFALLLASRLFRVSFQSAFTPLVCGAVAIFSILAGYQGLYRSWRMSPVRFELAGVFYAWGMTALLLLCSAYANGGVADIPPLVLFGWLALTLVAMCTYRLAVRGTLRMLRLNGRNFRTAAILGATEMGSRISHNVRNTAWMGIKVVGCYDDRAPADNRAYLHNLELVGRVDNLVAQARRGEIDIIYIALPIAAEARIKSLINRLSDTTVSIYFVPDFQAFDLLHARWDMLGNIHVINAIDSPNVGLDGALKRAFDIVAALLIISVILLPMIVIAIGTRLTSAGPIFFFQQRYGLNGKLFSIWKFRTMTVAEHGDDFRQVTRNDTRVTPFGAFLRRTSLDELPQFINVLQGHMSIVGPRPHPVAMNERQRKMVDRYMMRHKVKPGITGWAQVNGFRGETDTIDKIKGRIRLDLEYIDNWSILFDLKIIFKTLHVLVHDGNAY
jgi:putative colanic acid biosynthesis UDP-glucose lipid carrier transferase